MKAQDEVVIIGGGIGGLTLALALHREGVPFRVYEAVPEIKPLGVGLNLLSLSQEIAVDVDESTATKIVLAPGQFSFHHEKIIHGSAPNTSDGRRVGLAVRYIKPYERQKPNTIDHATLVRGVDRYETFFHDPAPRSDMDPEAVAYLDSVLVKKFGTRYRREKDSATNAS